MRRLDHKSVMITEGFWREHLNRIKEITVWDVLDKFEHDRGDGAIKNFEKVANGDTGNHVGHTFYDGLIYEVIRGLSDMIALEKDEKIEAKLDEYIDKISLAQDKDPQGYINTFVTLMRPNKRWGENGGNLLEQHELYNYGGLVEAGIHHYKATGKTKLLACAVKAANCMCSVMGPEPKKNIIPSHSIAEEAMVKLYRLFADENDLVNLMKDEYDLDVIPEEYLALTKFWIDHRGVHHNRASLPRYMGEYAQDHCRIEDQSEAVGHAVRAALLYTGLTALGIETGDEKYLGAAKRIWDNVELTKLHINGGIGAVHNEERFGYQYALPNDAYLETCAGVAMAFWAGEMYRVYGQSKYMDVFEMALYNNVLAGVSADGTHYFYENPLTSDGTIERWTWHHCPCCPPMFLKLMGALPDYIYAYDADRLAVNLHIGSRAQLNINGTMVNIEQKNCGIPWSGENHIILQPEKEVTFKLAIRKPAWAENFSVLWNNQVYSEVDADGYVVISDTFNPGDEMFIRMDLPAVKVEAHPYVVADAGKVALVHGPMLYCLEAVDNPQGVDVVLDNNALTIEKMDLFETIDCIKGTCADGSEFTAIPYYLWCNREQGKMNVWLDQADKVIDDSNLSGWEGKLYRKYEP